MKKLRLKSIMKLTTLALLLSLTAAHANLAFTLTPSVRSGVGSNEVTFNGTLTNTSLTTNLFLNDLQFSFTNAATNFLAAGTNAFFANVPGILLPGENYSDTICSVFVNPAITNGDYVGTANILGGSNIFSSTILSSQTFHLVLAPAPLTITRSGTNVILKWPSPPAAFILQQNSNLANTNWLTVTNLSAFTNGFNQTILSTTNTRLFYRLKYP
jgi:hypothetical protein